MNADDVSIAEKWGKKMCLFIVELFTFSGQYDKQFWKIGFGHKSSHSHWTYMQYQVT